MKMNLKEVQFENVNWTEWLRYGPLLGLCDHVGQPLHPIKAKFVLVL
jgi:hypothetical protein